MDGPKHISEPQRSGYFLIEFEEDRSKLYIDEDRVNKIELIRQLRFKKDPSVDHDTFICEHHSRSSFIATCELAAGENILKNLSAQQKNDPEIIEKLKRALFFFYPTESKQIEFLLTAQFANMSLRAASVITAIQLENYQKSLADSQPSPSLTTIQKLAQKKIKHSIYFYNSDQRKNYERALVNCIETYRESFKRLNFENSVEDASCLVEMKKRWTTLQDDFKRLRRCPEGKYNASLSIDSNTIIKRYEAQKARAVLDNYCSRMIAALMANSNQYRPDLVEYLIGPIKFWLARFGIVPDSKNNFYCVPALRETCQFEKGDHTAIPLKLHLDLNEVTPYKLIKNLKKQLESPEIAPYFQSIPCGYPTQIFSKQEDSCEGLYIQSNYTLKEKLKTIYFKNDLLAAKWFEKNPKPAAFKKYKETIEACHFASQKCENECPFVREIALKALHKINLYNHTLLDALVRYGFSSSSDLWPYINGENAFLFSYYGIVVDNMTPAFASSQIGEHLLHFSFVPDLAGKPIAFRGRYLTDLNQFFSFSLDELSPKMFETKIRDAIREILSQTKLFLNYQLPPRLIKSNQLTYQIPEETYRLQQKLFSFIENWKQLRKWKKEDVIRELLIFNQWHTYGILPQHVEIDFNIDEKNIHLFRNQPLTFKGRVKIGRTEYPFTFNSYNCFFKIDKISSQLNPSISKAMTLKFLKQFQNLKM